MANSKFQHYDLKQAKRKALTVASFGGVDFSSQKFNVESHRAVDIKNFVYRDGVIQKRHGYEQIAKLNLGNFNGIWRFLAEDNSYHTVAHLGTKLYVLSDDFKTATRLGLGEYENYRSFAFVGSNRLWFLGGNQYVVIRFYASYPNGIAEPVEDNDQTFIPTTSIGVTYRNAKVSGRSSLDYPNAMSMFRKNNLLSGVGKEEDVYLETKYYEYELDGSMLTKSAINDNDTFDDLSSNTEIQKAFAKINVVLKERGEIH